MNLLKRYVVPTACAMTVLALAACSSSKDERRVPVPLTEFKPVLNVQQVWKASVGKAGRYLFSPVAVGDVVYAAGANGSVAKIDAQTGKEIWSIKLKDDLSAGVGSDGTLTAVGGLKGQVYVLDANGKALNGKAMNGKLHTKLNGRAGAKRTVPASRGAPQARARNP